VLILLPPSEGKAEPAAGGQPVDFGSLVFAAELSQKREELVDAVDPGLRNAPAAPAAEIYTGVLFQRLDLPALPAAARRRAAERLLIASALWGFLRPTDRVPAYRFSAKSRLEGIGPPAGWWREALTEAMPDKTGDLIVDMRSAAYSAAWKPKQAALLAVRAFTLRDGERRAVTHMAKALRGEVTRALLTAKREARNVEQAAAIAEEAGFEVELTPSSLDVIV
jgi:cytoplasmic iron level regulating protein YaaA (DUF328/UPF0246 family)